MRGNRFRLYGLDVPTKHVADDSLEPEMKITARWQTDECIH